MQPNAPPQFGPTYRTQITPVLTDSGPKSSPILDLTHQTRIAPYTDANDSAVSRLLDNQRQRLQMRADHTFALLMSLQWLAAVGVAVWVSPYTWKGPVPFVHNHVWSALLLGGLFTIPPVLLAVLRSGRALTRHTVAVGQMLMSALLIHLTGGRIETHFHVFGSLAFLAVYKDWRVLLTASGVVAADHLLRGLFAPVSVFGESESAPLLRTLEHVWWVVFEVTFLIVTMIRGERLLRRVAAAAGGDVGPYHIVRLISSGGMGDVYLAEHRLLKRPCAVKVIRGEFASDQRAITRFMREVQTTASLRHPNTVEVFDYGVTDDGTFYYAMEYLEGQTLTELVRAEGPQPPARVVFLLRQVCGALGEAHRLGLVHRDINPNNILICRLGGTHDVIKLLDFGLVTSSAVEDQKLTYRGSFMGSPLYVSPEQARGLEVDTRSDLYSVGAVAHLLLTGRPPFESETAMDVLFAHMNKPPPRPSAVAHDLPAELDDLVVRCLAKQPDDRFPDADTLDSALAGCDTGAIWDPRRSTQGTPTLARAS